MKSLYSKLLLLIYTIYTFSSYSDENLNAGYAKLLALSLTDDISASKLNSDGFNYEKYSLPYEFKNLYVTDDYSFSIQLKSNYLKVKSSLINIDSVGDLRARWDILSISASPKVTYQINERLRLENELEFGYANMSNKSSFHGSQLMRDTLRDEGLLDWNMNSFHITPKIGLKNTNKLDNNDEINMYGHVSYMFANGFGNEKKLNINSNTGTWSIGGEYIMTDLISLNSINFNLILSNDLGGFYGNDYRELSFGFINNTSLALETPINIYDSQVKVRAGVGYLSSDNAHGIALTLGIR
ncbi:hypothetical protein GKR71_13445 [Providencia sp. wls1922]|jgi:hypothetical protein|uniref:hypothetical protein n=1 Tax=Providencia sp. wls1922 TaxID=2675152 RepID=UPI0012B57956|nr:hypothetical protein [Providencia sp. wls1922]MTC46836.1 hypothetical protein [Providencia sp. wls1922]